MEKTGKQNNITRMIILSYCVLVSIFLIFGAFALYYISTIASLTGTIYNHPMVVSAASLQANVSITKMHRNMKDVVLFHSPTKIQESIDSVNKEKKQVIDQLDIVADKILGQEGQELERETRNLFNDWQKIRDEVIDLVRRGEREKAAIITIGKGADHVALLENKILGLTQYARNKATLFKQEADNAHSILNNLSALLLIFGTFISVLIVLLTLKRTTIAEKDLHDSEERYRSLIESQSDLVSRFLPDGTFAFVNQNFCDFFNKKREELLGLNWQPLPVAGDVDNVQEKMASLSSSNRAVIIENRVYSGKGEVRWMQFVNKGFFDTSGELLEIQSVGRDITELKDAVSKINQQNKVLEGINRVFKESFKTKSVSDVAKLCLDVAESITSSKYGSLAVVNSKGNLDNIAINNPGWDQCESINSEQNHAVLDMEIKGIWEKTLNSSDGIIINDAEKHSDFKGIPQGYPPLKSFIGVPFHHMQIRGLIGLANKDTDYTSSDKEVIASLLVAFIEVIERKRAEEALQENEEKYRILFKSASDAVFLVDVESLSLLDANETAIALYGYSKEELMQKRALDLSDEASETKKILQQETPTTVPVRYHRKKDGTVFPVEITANYFELDGKSINISSIRDISERLEFEKNRNILESQLRQSQKMESIGNLAGGIAHDFNNILSAILGFTEMSLEVVEKNTSVEDNLQEVYNAGIRAKSLVKQILAFARQSEEEVKPVRPDKITTEVLKLLRSSLPTFIEINADIRSESSIMGNQTQIHQILMNLCTNAAHAMELNGGVLKVDLENTEIEESFGTHQQPLKPGTYLKLRVSDTGTGIKPEIKERIFEPYFTTKGPGEGTGMGLAMVHGIIDSYGGLISVESEVGSGTVFEILFPVTRRRKAVDAYESIQSPLGTERILFIDDEEAIARLGSRILENLGYVVTTRTSSVEALELFRIKPTDFDLVITDMTMPNITGDKLSVELLKIRPDIPIIICTGYSKKINDNFISDTGVKRLIYKPVVKADLASMVRLTLDEAKSS